MKPNSIVAVASDAGGARALLPVLEHAATHGHEVTALFSGHSAGFLDSLPAEIETKVITDSLSSEHCQHILAKPETDLLFSACGLYNSIEHTMRTAARKENIPILGMLDSWHNYSERFTREGSHTVWPDWICAIDETSQAGMVKAGFPAEQITVTGHPDLEKTNRQLVSNREQWRRSIRREIGHPDDEVLYIFLTDPFYFGTKKDHYTGPGAIMKQDGSPLYGYTTEDILPEVTMALSTALKQSGQHAQLVIRPHPSEWQQPLHDYVETFHHPNLTLKVDVSHSTPEWLAAADGVFGMMTIALLHSAFLQQPTLSVQIGLNASGEADPCVASQLGYVPLITDTQELRQACDQLIKTPQELLPGTMGHSIPLEGSTEHVYQIIKQLIKSSPHAV